MSVKVTGAFPRHRRSRLLPSQHLIPDKTTPTPVGSHTLCFREGWVAPGVGSERVGTRKMASDFRHNSARTTTYFWRSGFAGGVPSWPPRSLCRFLPPSRDQPPSPPTPWPTTEKTWSRKWLRPGYSTRRFMTGRIIKVQSLKGPRLWSKIRLVPRYAPITQHFIMRSMAAV